jgi:nitrite reductase/ring-hydroxylating ferredoxin subunit
METPVARPKPAPHWRWRFPRGPVFAVALAAVLLATVGVIVATAWPRGDKVDPGDTLWVEVANVDDLAVAEPLILPDPRIFLVRLESGDVLALSRQDPRNGCTVPWNPSYQFQGVTGWFREPCHGSTYDIAGNLAFGPSTRGMDRYPVRVEEDGDIEVNVRELIPGPAYGASPSVNPAR